MGMTIGVASSSGRRRHQRRPVMAEINVTPMVDVMLVLLIIFMISAPMLVGVPIDMPQTQAKRLEQDREPLTIKVNEQDQVFLQDVEISLDELIPKLKAVMASEILSVEGHYLGTVFYENRIYRRSSPPPKKRDIGFVMGPADAPYVSHPGHAAPYAAPHGYKDVDMGQFPTGKRTWLRTNRPTANSDDPSAFETWMSKIGLGGLARAIEGMFRS